MTMTAHPLELELLALVEGDLGRSETRALEEHLAGCLACSAAVAQQRATRELLRAAPAVELSQVDVRRLVRALPAHPPRPLPWWRRPVALVAAPSLGIAAAAVAVALSLSGGGGGGGGGGRGTVPGGDTAQPSALAAKVAGTSARAERAPRAATVLLRAVAGTVAAVSGRLAAAGVVATVEDGAVVVLRADAAKARKALASLPAGPVRVLLR